MFISLTPSTDRLVTDASGEAFIPTSRILYVDAFYAFLALEPTLWNYSFGYKKLYAIIHDRLILWLNENLTGKFDCPLYSFESHQSDICFELEQDAVLFKLTFS